MIALVALLLISGAMWAWMIPKYPSLPNHADMYEQDASYYPGSQACMPSRLAKLPPLQVDDEKYKCALALERESDRELAQTARSADSAVAAVEVGFRQTMLLIAGTIFGVWTLIAAAFAAWYGRAAAVAAQDGLKNSIEAQKPTIVFSLEDIVETVGQNASLTFNIAATNVGGSGCVVNSVRHTWTSAAETPRAFLQHNQVTPIPPGETRRLAKIEVLLDELYEHPFLLGGAHMDGPFVEKSSPDRRFAFSVNRKPTIHGTHYSVLSDHVWTR
ncbi:hypothetical protein IFR23_02480 [Sphingomonas sp. CFBP 13603]|uniref:hypothetical protein n=1 Tax=Sphingomonas sp. CFBP 13603 TaxID=2774040 RepID=UPI00186815DD|nr:hypothetical protein [Sphingomonas sp. CFBP 13603]MBE2990874.1 hypothetical protein [Sphingomonas sp. CFBP 13603]